MYLIPNCINIIWMGSFLRETEKHPHQSRILKWKQSNPEHIIYIWTSNRMIDSTTYDKFQAFCDDNSLVLKKLVLGSIDIL